MRHAVCILAPPGSSSGRPRASRREQSRPSGTNPAMRDMLPATLSKTANPSPWRFSLNSARPCARRRLCAPCHQQHGAGQQKRTVPYRLVSLQSIDSGMEPVDCLRISTSRLPAVRLRASARRSRFRNWTRTRPWKSSAGPRRTSRSATCRPRSLRTAPWHTDATAACRTVARSKSAPAVRR